ncbi:MAG: peptidoglycan DD-metalloendopeptidase family protein [Proteobacteria bacterium]|nr:peptidoglycan DD-metalloendopeptidase family protein [Pseudomonadota bacterium]
MFRIKLSTSPTELRAFFSIFLFFWLFFSFNVASASKNEDMSHYQDKLEKLQKSIAKVQQHLKGNKKQRSHVVTELHTLETEISKNSRKLKNLEKAVHSSRQQERKLKNELKLLNKQLNNQRKILSEQIRSAYSMGHQQNIKMLLNQQDPAQAGRTQAYFNYLNRARQQQIDTFLATFELKKQTETSLKQTLKTQDQLLKTQKEKKRERQKQRFQRKKLLAELSKKIKNQESTLSSLENSRGRIENLLKSLGELLADIPTSPSEKQPFLSLKGKLPWPAKGRFINSFGQPKNYGDLKWNGILIKTELGTPVRVISHGRVAFADWLQGFGFITIVDHGDGYMSLYGHNESLFKQMGDWVQAGEVIATAGDSGGQPVSGVYFEIRSRGKPVNPSKWCSRKARHATGQNPSI